MKKSFFLRIGSALLLFVILLSFFGGSLPVSAAVHLPTVTGASSVYLYNFESDRVLLKQTTAKMIVPGATVKIMTGLLALQRLANRQDEQITVTEDMLAGVNGYTINLEPNTTLKIRDLLYGLICGGGNDAAHILAILVSGSVDSFVAEMNAQAQAWGCIQTNYTNPTGMDDPQMVTTLEDTVILAKKAIDNPIFLEMCSAVNYAYTPLGAEDSTLFYNRNAQISTYTGAGYLNRYVKGLNAGMTEKGGYSVVSYATNGMERYLCIIMGGMKTTAGILSYYHANNLLNHLFQGYSYCLIAQAGDQVYTAPIQYALPEGRDTEATVPCSLTKDLYGFIPIQTDVKKDLEYRFYFHEEMIRAPIEVGTIVGGVDVYLQGEWIAGSPIAVAKSVESSAIQTALASARRILLGRASIIAVILLVPLLVLYFYFSGERYRRKRTKTIVLQ